MSGHLGRVLLIDDEDIDQRQYHRILSRSGLTDEIIQFTYADEALDWILADKTEPPDIIFLDINIPRMNGFEFLAALQATQQKVPCPIVFVMTTSLKQEDKVQANQFEMVQGYFTKPLTPAHLQEAVGIINTSQPE